MEAISKQLYALIVELQSLHSLNQFALAGGTNLALRYNHRVSDDIDLFSNEIVGIAGLTTIKEEIKIHFQDSLLYAEIMNSELGDQYCFLRALIKKDGVPIKVEILQNMKTIDLVELFHNVRLLSKKDIGLFKLMSASNRKANKDIYDLDIITDELSLEDLLNTLKEKKERYNLKEHKCLFDLDHEINPLNDLAILLDFDNIDYNSLPSRPSHSNDRISIVLPKKTWSVARSSWRRKVRDLMKSWGIEPPPIKPIN